MTQW